MEHASAVIKSLHGNIWEFPVVGGGSPVAGSRVSGTNPESRRHLLDQSHEPAPEKRLDTGDCEREEGAGPATARPKAESGS